MMPTRNAFDGYSTPSSSHPDRDSPALERVDVTLGYDSAASEVLPSAILENSGGIPPEWNELLGINTESNYWHLMVQAIQDILESEAERVSQGATTFPPRTGDLGFYPWAGTLQAPSFHSFRELLLETMSQTSDNCGPNIGNSSKQDGLQPEAAAGTSIVSRRRQDMPANELAECYSWNSEEMSPLGIDPPFDRFLHSRNSSTFSKASSRQAVAAILPDTADNTANRAHWEGQLILPTLEHNQRALSPPTGSLNLKRNDAGPQKANFNGRRKCDLCTKRNVDCVFVDSIFTRSGRSRRPRACNTCQKAKAKCVAYSLRLSERLGDEQSEASGLLFEGSKVARTING